MNKGRLYLIPTPLAEGPLTAALPAGTLEIVSRLEHFIVEEIRTARRFLAKAGTAKPIDELDFLIFNEHTKDLDPHDFLLSALHGADIGLLSEAGVPCVADPGAAIVAAAHELGIRVVPLTGPSSMLLALMASGFNGQNFCFHGYLPADKSLRAKKIRELEKTAREIDQTQLFIETPYRNMQMFESLISVCAGSTMLCIAADVTGPNELIISKPISLWKKSRPDLHKTPAIFLLYRPL